VRISNRALLHATNLMRATAREANLASMHGPAKAVELTAPP
jgi:hypothetical protein